MLLNTEFKPENKAGYDEVIVATGAKEKKLSIPGFDQPNVRYAVDVLMNQNIQDQNVVIVGAVSPDASWPMIWQGRIRR